MWLAVSPLPLPGWPTLVYRDPLWRSVYMSVHHESRCDVTSSLKSLVRPVCLFLFLSADPPLYPVSWEPPSSSPTWGTHLSLTAMSLLYLLLAAPVAQALRYDPAYSEYNLNTNQQAVSPLDYSGEREGFTYHPSPDNWRFPFYTVMLDKWVNGDPSNDNANGTLFEQDIWSTQLRHGGDIQGLVDSLDYIQGMGIKVCSSELTTRLITRTNTLSGNLHCRLAFHKPAMGRRCILGSS